MKGPNWRLSQLLGIALLAMPLSSLADALQTPEAILAKLQPLPLQQRVAGIQYSVDLQIPFALNSASLSDAALPQLQALATALATTQLANCRFYLIGHTDISGPAALNDALSAERAAAVKHWLWQQEGLQQHQLESRGLGSRQLLPGLAATDPMHRRVEVRLAEAEDEACALLEDVIKSDDGELHISW